MCLCLPLLLTACAPCNCRLQGDFDFPLTHDQLGKQLLDESAGTGPGYRGKMRVPPPHALAKHDTDAPRGKRGNAELDAKLGKDEVRLMLDPFSPAALAEPIRRIRPGVRHVAFGPATQPDQVKILLESIAALHKGEQSSRSNIVGRRAPPLQAHTLSREPSAPKQAALVPVSAVDAASEGFHTVV